MTALDRLAPREARYVHDTEGPDDMPAHIRAMLTGAVGGDPGARRAGSRSAPGRASISSSTATARTGARSCSTSSAREAGGLERDDFSSSRHPALPLCLSMIFSENRFPLFGIMLYLPTSEKSSASTPMTTASAADQRAKVR